MFTGITEEIGTVKSVQLRGGGGAVIEIYAARVLYGTVVGDSISTNGVCLTVSYLGDGFFRADVMPESVRRTNLGMLRPGDRVNLERALRLDGRLGGHIVSGHVDGTARIAAFERDDNAVWITVAASPQLMKYIVMKGSVAIDGVSLTVAYEDGNVFKVSVIPHTQSQTTLVSKRTGDCVNIENDIMARYAEKIMAGRGILKPGDPDSGSSGGGLTEAFLAENGF